MTNQPGLLRAYVDETGDRGVGPKASPYFAFAGLILADEDEPAMRAAMSGLRRDLKVPHGKALHWKDHVKTHSRRQHVARAIAELPRLQVVYVIVEKAAIPVTAEMRQNQTIFYNFAAGIVLERILLAAKTWPGGARRVAVRFGHVRGFDHRKTHDYFDRKKGLPPEWVPWHLLAGGKAHFEDQASWDGLQAADQFAGMLSAALRPDEFGGYDESHLLRVRHHLRRDPQGKSINYGFKVLGNVSTFANLPWWPQAGL